MISLNTRPAERQRGCKFAETFATDARVTQNGGTATGSPDFSGAGIGLNGTTQYVSYSLNGGEFQTDNFSVEMKFVPDFAYDEDATRYLFQTTAGNEYSIRKGDNAASNALYLYLGDVEFTVASGTYSSYWNVGEVNIITVYATNGTTIMRLNGNEILNDATAWTAKSPVALSIGASLSPSGYFDGRIMDFRIYNVLLTQQECADYEDSSTWSYMGNCVAAWEMVYRRCLNTDDWEDITNNGEKLDDMGGNTKLEFGKGVELGGSGDYLKNTNLYQNIKTFLCTVKPLEYAWEVSEFDLNVYLDNDATNNLISLGITNPVTYIDGVEGTQTKIGVAQTVCLASDTAWYVDDFEIGRIASSTPIIIVYDAMLHTDRLTPLQILDYGINNRKRINHI